MAVRSGARRTLTPPHDALHGSARRPVANLGGPLVQTRALKWIGRPIWLWLGIKLWCGDGGTLEARRPPRTDAVSAAKLLGPWPGCLRGDQPQRQRASPFFVAFSRPSSIPQTRDSHPDARLAVAGTSSCSQLKFAKLPRLRVVARPPPSRGRAAWLAITAQPSRRIKPDRPAGLLIGAVSPLSPQ